MIKNKPPISAVEAKDLLWHEGVLTWKLDSNQKSLYDVYKNAKSKIIVWNCSRRLGKSFTLCVVALETCLQNPKAIVKYSCPKQKDATNIIRPLFRQILEDCPEDIRPTFIKGEGLYRFKNGAELQLTGLDSGRADSIRGGSAWLCVVDEAGFVDDLEYVVQSVLIPTTLTTKGKIILASTPPESIVHPYVKYLNIAKFDGNLVTKTIYDNPRLTKQDIDDIIRQYGSEEDNAFRREYLAHIIADENYTVVPEFTEELQKRIIKEWPAPPFRTNYVAMDPGLIDLTVVLFGYYDFRADKVIIVDEFAINGQKLTTEALAQGIKEKERDNFTDKFTGELLDPYLRVSDNNLILINDLQKLHGLLFMPTRKDDSSAALNNMKVMLKQEKIIIHPRCKILISHLADATWNKNKTSYNRSPDKGHFDAIDSLKYLIRNVIYSHNPYPSHYGFNRENSFTPVNKQTETNATKVYKTIFNVGQPKKEQSANDVLKFFNKK